MDFGKRNYRRKAFIKMQIGQKARNTGGSVTRISVCHLAGSRDRKGENSGTNNLTYGQWFQKWMDVYKKDTVKVGTYTCYLDYYNSIIRDELKDKRILDIDAESIQKFYNSLAEKGYSTSTIKIISCIINSSLIQATRNNILKENPVQNTYMPRAKEKVERSALSRKDQETFMRYAQKSYLYYFFCVMLRTGMRNGELRGLKWEDIDEENKVLHICRTIKYNGTIGYFEDTPKTKSSKRDIPLTDDLLILLNEYVKTNNIDKIKNEFIFRNSRGGTLGRESVQNEIDKIVGEINESGVVFKRFTPHVLRHTFATRAVEAGMQPQVLKNIMGHGSIAVTMDIYSHVMPEIRREEMEKISAIFK